MIRNMKINSFGVEDFLNVYETRATLDIAQSTITSFTFEELLKTCNKTENEVFDEIKDFKLNYGFIEGSPKFKTEVKKLYRRNENELDVLATNGATGANFLALYTLLEEGDHIIAHYPSYQQLYDIPLSFNVEVSHLDIDENNNWLPNIDSLESMIKPNTKMICLNNAQNPTGAYMDEDYLNKLVDIAKKYDLYVLCDEVYKPFEKDLKIASIVDLYHKGISTNSLSKTYSVPGLRVGWVCANNEIIDMMRKYRDYTMICIGVLDDYFATLVLENRDKVLARNEKIIYENYEILKEWIKKEELASCILPKHISTSFVKLDVKMPIEDFCIKLLEDTGILLVPGSRFGYESYVRLGYCAKKEVLIEALDKLSTYMHNSI